MYRDTTPDLETIEQNLRLSWYFKDDLPYLLHGFRNKYFDKISLGNMLYFHN